MLDCGALVLEVRIKPTTDFYCSGVIPQKNLTNNVLKILQHEDYADVSFQVQGRIFHAHKAILKVQAPNLANLCESCNKTNTLPINDVEQDMLNLCLRTCMAQ
jgi:hypothetical protein